MSRCLIIFLYFAKPETALYFVAQCLLSVRRLCCPLSFCDASISDSKRKTFKRVENFEKKKSKRESEIKKNGLWVLVDHTACVFAYAQKMAFKSSQNSIIATVVTVKFRSLCSVRQIAFQTLRLFFRFFVSL